MKYEVKKNEKSSVEVKINLENEELKPILDEVVKEIAAKVEIPGFRKGKAPQETIINHNREHINEEVVNKVINTKFGEIVEKEKLEPVSYIRLKNYTLDDKFEVIFDVDVYPNFEIANYKGLEVEKEKFEMKDEILNEEIENLLNTHSKLEDVSEENYEAQNGDTVDLFFEGFVDGVPFAGGKAESHLLKLGSKSFIDNFEEQLIGYKKGQEGEVNVKFPDEYHSKELAGKPATFKVKINTIKKNVRPELNDEFAKSLSYESVEDLKNKRREAIIKRKNEEIENKYIYSLLDEISKNTNIEIPESMILGEVENRIREFEYQLSAQGLKMEDYIKMMGGNKEMFVEQIKPVAATKVKSDLILNKIAELEDIKVSDEEIKSRMEETAKLYGMDLTSMENELNKNHNLNNFKNSLRVDILMKKAIDFIVDNAKK